MRSGRGRPTIQFVALRRCSEAHVLRRDLFLYISFAGRRFPGPNVTSWENVQLTRRLKSLSAADAWCHDRAMVNVPSAGSISVADLIGDAVVRVPSDATVATAAEAMAEAGIGAVVVGDQERPVALVSERDAIRVIAAHQDPAAVPVVDVASTNLVWCAASDTVEKVAVRMTDRHIRHILVERAGVLVGIVSARDLLGVYAAEADPVV